MSNDEDDISFILATMAHTPNQSQELHRPGRSTALNHVQVPPSANLENLNSYPFTQLYNQSNESGLNRYESYSGAEEPFVEERIEQEIATTVKKGRGKSVNTSQSVETESGQERARKDNHKEVERKRRETINGGIAALKLLLPPSQDAEDKKAVGGKGAILTAAASYIELLKHSERNNIEKWTLEKQLTDRALQEARGEAREYKRMFEVVESENEALKEKVRLLGGESEVKEENDDELQQSNKRYRLS